MKKIILAFVALTSLITVGCAPVAAPDTQLRDSALIYAQNHYANPQSLKTGDYAPEYYGTRPDDAVLESANRSPNDSVIVLGDVQEDRGVKSNGETIDFKTYLVNHNGVLKMVVTSYSESGNYRLRAFTENDLSKEPLVAGQASALMATTRSLSLTRIYQYLLVWLQKTAADMINAWITKLTADAEKWLKDGVGPALAALLGRQQKVEPTTTKAATEEMSTAGSIGQSFRVGIRKFSQNPKTAKTLEDFLISAGSRFNGQELQ